MSTIYLSRMSTIVQGLIILLFKGEHILYRGEYYCAGVTSWGSTILLCRGECYCTALVSFIVQGFRGAIVLTPVLLHPLSSTWISTIESIVQQCVIWTFLLLLKINLNLLKKLQIDFHVQNVHLFGLGRQFALLAIWRAFKNISLQIPH